MAHLQHRVGGHASVVVTSWGVTLVGTDPIHLMLYAYNHRPDPLLRVQTAVVSYFEVLYMIKNYYQLVV